MKTENYVRATVHGKEVNIKVSKAELKRINDFLNRNPEESEKQMTEFLSKLNNKEK